MANSTIKTKENLKNNIKKYRKKLGLTQVELSIQADISTYYVSDLEIGRRNPSLDVLCKIADALKVEAFELLK